MSVVDRYLELALRLGKHDEDLVDSFAGPEELAQRVEAESLRDPAALAEEAEALLAELGDDPWLAAQARALWANARKLAGERFTYAEEGRLVYGIEPRWHDEEAFGRAARLLDEALPANGDLRGALRGVARGDRDPTGAPRGSAPACRGRAAAAHPGAHRALGW
jgi:hypothetical protein